MTASHGDDRSKWPYDPATYVVCIEGNIWGGIDTGAIWRSAIHPAVVNAGFTSTPL